jgi:hypothetical protein
MARPFKPTGANQLTSDRMRNTRCRGEEIGTAFDATSAKRKKARREAGLKSKGKLEVLEN